MRLHRFVLAMLWLAAFLCVSCGGGGSSSPSGGGGVQVQISPSPVAVAPGGAVTFQATVTGTSNQAVTWSASLGTITTAGVYTAPTIVGTYTVTATSVADATKSASVSVVVTSSSQVSISVTPKTATLGFGDQVQFSAAVSGASDQRVTWTASSGSIDSNGLYTAPSIATVVTVRAHSVADPTATASAQVTITNSGPIVHVTPISARLPMLATYQFSARVQNSTNQAVTWTATGGTIDSSGLFTAGRSLGTYQVTATSAANPSVSASASVVITAVDIVVSSPKPVVVTNQQMQFSASVFGISQTGVTWSTSAGTITSHGLLTAPSTPQTITVTATSVVNAGYTGSETVTVVNPTDDFYDFVGGVPSVWSPQTAGATPSGVAFLGAFGKAQSATLSLSSLSPHTSLTVKFDLYVIGGWTGSTPFAVSLDGNSAFSQSFSNVSGDNQTYPDGNTNPPGTGAAFTNTLGYSFSPSILYNDATYHVVLSNVSHSADTVTIVFSSNLSGAASAMSWGLKNVEVIANP